jgi:hypothetical protein
MANATAPICEKCGDSLAFVGKLAAIRLFPLPEVYKCSPCNQVVAMRPRAFSSEVDTGSREENASKQESRPSVLIQSEPKRL